MAGAIEVPRVVSPIRIATLGDVLLDVLLEVKGAGDLALACDAQGAVRLAPGGSAANFAAIGARAGAQVSFFGRVGDDVAGRILVAELERDGVTARIRVSAGCATGQVLVIVGADGAGSSRMISDPGASALLAPDDLDADVFAAADLVHLSGYSWLREGPAAAARAAFRIAREGKAILTFDPGPAHLIQSYGHAKLMSELTTARVDVLFPNHEEGIAMTSRGDPNAIVAALRAVADVVVLKEGAAGCLVAWDGGIARVPAVATSIVDTTGAGDAFAAGFAVEYIRSHDPLAAARAGSALAAATVSRMGSR